MPQSIKPGSTVRVTIVKSVRRAAARKTLERVFMSDAAFRKPVEARTRRFTDRPKRRGGRIYTKYATKVHPTLETGRSVTVRATPQFIKDLSSVSDFVSVSAA
jgi:hypothetical protein